MADLATVNAALANPSIDGSVRSFLAGCQGLVLPPGGPSVADTATFLRHAQRTVPPGTIRDCLRWLIDFAEVRSILHGFPHFPRTSVAAMAAVRLLEPTSVNQMQTETCGPTAFSINLCRNRPRVWLDTLLSLANQGKAKLGELDMRPDTDVRHRKPNETAGIAPVDWIMVASLRSTLCGLWAYKAVSKFKGSLEKFGIHSGALFDWLVATGFRTVCLIGESGLGDALVSRRSVKKIHGGNSPLAETLNGLEATPEALLRFLSPRMAKRSWSAFLVVEARLSDALQTGTAADVAGRNARLDLVGSPRPPAPASFDAMRPAFTQQAVAAYAHGTTDKLFGAGARLQRARAELTSTNKHGHIMLLHDIEVGGFYASCTVSNYGELMHHHTLPVKDFLATVKTVVAATDRTR